MPFVVDNSVIVAWHLSGQATSYTEAMLDALATDTAHVPALWPLEFSNVLRKALVGRKISEDRARDIMKFQAGLAVTVHGDVADPADNMALALRYGLSSYDAAYLELALRLHLPIATRDDALRTAAETSGVGVVVKNQG
jgi:predicted nucleic acid-binding protein